jgi:hypothetical protein
MVSSFIPLQISASLHYGFQPHFAIGSSFSLLVPTYFATGSASSLLKTRAGGAVFVSPAL